MSSIVHPTSRVGPLDTAKGLAAVLMVLGHAEIFLNPKAYFPYVFHGNDYLDIQYLYNFGLYLLQSSVDAFYFFAGVSIAISCAKSKSLASLGIQLRKRALFLTLVDLSLISWTYSESPTSFKPMFGSIASFGISFWLTSFMLRWRPRAILSSAILMLVVREIVLIREPFDADSLVGILYGVFWSPIESVEWSTLFTVTSWLPIIWLGICFGKCLLSSHSWLRPGRLMGVASLLLVLFFVCRVFLLFGSLGQPPPSNLVQVLQLEKYPASIHFHMLNMSFAFFYLLLAVQAGQLSVLEPIRRTTALLGAHIFFVYILHLVILAVFKWSGVFESVRNSDFASILGFIACILLVVPLTYRYNALKGRHKDKFWILRYV